MSLTKEDLSALSQMLDQQMENHLHPIKMELNELKTAQQQTQLEVAELKTAQQLTQQDVAALKLHLENTTDKNLQILAENHITLVNKLNQAIPAVEKNLVYEVKVNYLMEEMQILKKDVAFLKSKIA